MSLIAYKQRELGNYAVAENTTFLFRNCYYYKN